jgi:hypothetical protein
MEKAVTVFGAEQKESLADRVLPFAAMLGAVGGAIGGTVLGFGVGTAFPIMCGALGTMLGSGLIGGGWCLLARACTSRSARSEAHHEQPDGVAIGHPAPSAG